MGHFCPKCLFQLLRHSSGQRPSGPKYPVWVIVCYVCCWDVLFQNEYRILPSCSHTLRHCMPLNVSPSAVGHQSTLQLQVFEEEEQHLALPSLEEDCVTTSANRGRHLLLLLNSTSTSLRGSTGHFTNVLGTLTVNMSNSFSVVSIIPAILSSRIGWLVL